MSQVHFTLDLNQIKDEVMNSNLNSVLKSSVVLILNQYMELERDKYLKAGAYERTSERVDYRNGYYERDYIMTLGKLQLKVPRTRSGEFHTTVFEKYQRSEQAIILSMLEMVINGVSTRKVTKIVQQLCGQSVSKSLVSSLTKKLDPIVNEWANRPLGLTYYKYVYVDAMYIKVREHQRIVSKAVYMAIGVNSEHKREIIGLSINHAESKEGWKQFFDYLKSRGLQSPRLVISDAHQGLRLAIQESFVGTSWQRCTFHLKRNIHDVLPKKNTADVKQDLKNIFEATTPERARELKDQFMNRYKDQPSLQKALNILEEGFEDAIQYLNEPSAYHAKLRTTNQLERLNEEIRRRERVIRIFPNTQSAFRLIGAILMDYEDQLDLGNRKYLPL